MIISRGLFFRLLAHAPEALQREAKEKAQRAIPALCFTETDIRQKLVQEEGWKDLSENERHEAMETLMDASQYDSLTATANRVIAETVGNYMADAPMEKAEQQKEGGSNELQ
jgi:hypothetical protein